ncbi:MAG TPA: class I adenylate-forming enzyme family protein [Spongiibacteraceae bacterium]|nr:class I adenylate-forming enzyme family protein [Spongiibacteraceae bacterium]
MSYELTLEQHYDERSMLCFAERPATIDTMFRAIVANLPDHIALVFNNERTTYAELEQHILAVVTQLRARNIRQGDRVAMLLGNRPAFLYALLAIARIGAIAVPMNIRQRRPEILYMLQHCGASALFFDAECAAELPDCAELPALHSYFRADQNSIFHLDTRSSTSITAQGTSEAIEIAEEDVFCILYTSGTTGKPKGAMLTNLGIVHSLLHYKYAFDLQPSDAALLAVPASHVTGLVSILLATICVGGRNIIMENFNARDFLELAAHEKMTYTLVVPAIYNLCLLQPDFDRFDLSAWRIGGFGGAPMPVATIERLSAALPKLALANVYGATETTGPTTILPLGEALRRRDTVGKLLTCADVRVCDENGAQVEAGESGELLIAGPMVIPGYWENPQANADSFIDGYWRSGDIGSIDAEGWVRIFDRKKDLINRGGYKVYCTEVENILSRHEGVIECAAVGRPDTVLGERVHAFVVRKTESISPDELRAHCAVHLSDYKVPETIDFIDALPRNANGKVVKPQLRELLVASELNR